MSIKINCEETNVEVLARIAKAAARKYDCDVTIDFQNGNRRIEFSGDAANKAKIANTVEAYFRGPSERDREDAATRPEGL
jgi:metal-dependent amidase/aminoacylase/carboxypeptidase family protein